VIDAQDGQAWDGQEAREVQKTMLSWCFSVLSIRTSFSWRAIANVDMGFPTETCLTVNARSPGNGLKSATATQMSYRRNNVSELCIHSTVEPTKSVYVVSSFHIPVAAQ
jgi:hypothetical protein